MFPPPVIRLDIIAEQPSHIWAHNRGVFSPVVVHPFPKTEVRKVSTKRRKRKVTAILTDTPVKLALEQEAEERKRKKRKRRSRRHLRSQKKIQTKTSKPATNGGFSKLFGDKTPPVKERYGAQLPTTMSTAVLLH
ncbi:hypothetical protein AAFF_G00343570 [Aldrovandia affinis]|uniref:Uncharacterized protein n=1 Tax=Aldrovandia affinis TaxID=143900 RepID=A0AAD7WP10_9TELE|nr:hypothetical protein AAFF_G00343570 [Aldrovandia affinis]